MSEFSSKRSKQEVRAIIRSIPAAIKGTGPDPHGLGEVYRSALIHSMITSVYAGFLIKSLGGTDSCGHSWPDLSPRTKAYHRPDARIGLDLPGPLQRPTLTETQNAFWKAVYSKSVARAEKKITNHTPRTPKRRKRNSSSQRSSWRKRFTAGVADLFSKLTGGSETAYNAFQSAVSVEQAQARKNAAQLAWNLVKSKLGATTLIELLAGVRVPINQGSGRLLKSYQPSPYSVPYRPINSDQVAELQGTHLHIDSQVPYKPPAGSRRAIVPPDITPWVEKAKKDASAALKQRLSEIL